LDSLKHALKEWAVAIEALERGRTALLIRKGGIREKSFAVPEARFLLYKSYEHQRPDLLKPAYRDLLRDIPSRRDDEPIVLTSLAEVVGAYEISEPEALAALEPHHMWSREYAEKRFRWRPKKPLTVLVLRTHLLPEPVELPYSESYGGCKSWVELESQVLIEGATPALGERDFEELAAPALEVLQDLEPASVGTS